MQYNEKWIWLPKKEYPDDQNTIFSSFMSNENKNFCVAEFTKKYNFQKKILHAEIRFSADTAIQLFLNGNIIATGPVCVGGDFIGNETARENYYSSEITVFPNSDSLDFFARVKMLPVQICEYSKGHGGFMMSAILTFEDGTKQVIETDDSWLVRKNNSYCDNCFYDGRKNFSKFTNAEITKNIWNTTVAPIPIREENELFAENSKFKLSPFEEKKLVLDFDKIWAGFVRVQVKAQGEVSVKVICRELEENGSAENLYFKNSDEYRGFLMHSVGNMVVTAKNYSDNEAEVSVSLIETHYPIFETATTHTSDSELNDVLETCKHTLKICRQTHHLDSPRHCEPMACTGDYYIESLMTLFSFGDMDLARFDLIRTAFMLERENGRLFHTTYSLIWVKMLYDVYMITGNNELLTKCKKALTLLLSRFETYIGTNGLIENPPDYMFIDWIYIDELSMHHPPKALGQTCLNMFYFGALDTAEKIYNILSDSKNADICATKKALLKNAINNNLFDGEKNMYFMGLNTPTDESLLGHWMPQNTNKKYYLKHANILAAYFGVCEDNLGRELIKKVMSDEIEGECQPYFMHFLLEAVYRLGLREEYTLKIVELWKKPIKECNKGLVEGFIAPEPSYCFDHSHAWGGTPLYSLPKALLGLEINSPTMKEITLSPTLLGLDFANVEMLTPYGKLICKIRKDKETEIICPDDVTVHFK